MTSGGRESICCGGRPVKYFWHACSQSDDHIEATVDELVAALKGIESRCWNEDVEAGLRGEFRSRLRRAAEGRLRNSRECRRLKKPLPRIMFEVKWDHLEMMRHDVGRGDLSESLQARLIYVEPDLRPGTVIGLRGHEKVIVPGDVQLTRDLQNDQIEAACRIYDAGEARGWAFLD